MLNNLPSGWTEENVFDESLQRFRDIEPKGFKFIEAWKVLRTCPKFSTCQSTQGVIDSPEVLQEGEENAFRTPDRVPGSKRAKISRSDNSNRDAQRAEMTSAASSMAAQQKQNNELLAEQNRLLQEKTILSSSKGHLKERSILAFCERRNSLLSANVCPVNDINVLPYILIFTRHLKAQHHP